jgi:hypothetical protein
MLQVLRTFMSRMRLDVLSSPADWAFVMAEADALQSEDPSGCVETARQRAQAREGWRYELVAAELMRRAAAVRPARLQSLLVRPRAFEDDPVR